MLYVWTCWVCMFVILNDSIDAAVKPMEVDDCNTVADICLLPMDVGFCRAFLPSYYYDVETKACVMFIYGGCLGNCNNFATVEECEKACPTKIKSFRMKPTKHHVTGEQPIWEEDWLEYLPEEEWSSFEPEPDQLDYPPVDKKNTLRVSGRPWSSTSPPAATILTIGRGPATKS